ncbi:Serine/threonine protein kinase [Phytophthora palmivora]|uniref:Serine/threonine protein kinase n=1 Tax=Phytophthora palmivora TaxID=4796 RepID=A0A2P4YM94_9STRA|nr:Serine/threonine protein kinase [Phytophthora palmivora]
MKDEKKNRRAKFADDAVMKRYPLNLTSNAIIRKVKMLHRLMEEHSVPNVEELKAINLKKKCVVLKFIGLPFQPMNVRQLLMALRDVLEALIAVHAINLMHRDLRWDNVLKYLDEQDKWFIIDVDEAALSPATKVGHLNADSHAPEILTSSHTVKVVIWSVGYLLKTSIIPYLPAELNTLKTLCLQQAPS